MACQRCNSKSVPTAAVTVSLPNREQGHRGETIEVERELCGPCRAATAAVFPVEGGEELLIAEEPAEEPEEEDDEDPLWFHKGGGYYENRETGETRRGRPDDDEDEDETEEEGESEEEDEGEETASDGDETEA